MLTRHFVSHGVGASLFPTVVQADAAAPRRGRVFTPLGLALLAPVMACLCGQSEAREEESSRAQALSLLQRCLTTQSFTDHMSVRVTTLRDIPDSIDGWPRDQRAGP